MEVLEWAGVPTVLFLEPPDPQTVHQRFPDVRAMGIAGVSRSMSPDQMDDMLPSAFEALKALNAPFVHYKVCSTFDSSPTVGNIGHATEIGMRVFKAKCVPMMVGAPALRRYVAFSNLFARVDDETYRLDRHPTMSKHPVTPMNESDLRIHFGRQTDLRVAAMNIWHMERCPSEVDSIFHQMINDGAQVILFDSINNDHLYTIGRIVWGLQSDVPVFLVGSSGFQYALAHYWNTEGIVQKPPTPRSPGAVDQLIVVSGSAAPATAEQITWSMQNGFEGIRLDSASLVDPDTADFARETVVNQALEALGSGKNLLLFSANGPEDPAIPQTKARLEQLGMKEKHVGSLLGPQQGRILRELLEKTGLHRVMVVGGDTCGYATRQLGIFALRAITPLAPGAPLCRAFSDNPLFDGLEIVLKAGQIGTPDFFDRVRQ